MVSGKNNLYEWPYINVLSKYWNLCVPNQTIISKPTINDSCISTSDPTKKLTSLKAISRNFPLRSSDFPLGIRQASLSFCSSLRSLRIAYPGADVIYELEWTLILMRHATLNSRPVCPRSTVILINLASMEKRACCLSRRRFFSYSYGLLYVYHLFGGVGGRSHGSDMTRGCDISRPTL